MTLQLWDTAGQERFQSLSRAFYRGAEACMLVFDLTDKKSFDSIPQWKEELLNKSMPKDPESFPFFLMGNKADLVNDREVPAESVQRFLDENQHV